MSDHPQIVVLGAGAAGLVAATHAAGPGRRVLLLERTADGGRKILISGGGRCNVLPAALDPRRFVSNAPPHLVRRILAGWPLPAMRHFFEHEAGLPLVVEPATGKLFPVANRSRAVRDALRRLAKERGVTFRGGCEVTGLQPEGNRWRLTVRNGEPIVAAAVVVATGGLSVPQTGSDGFGQRTLAALGHTVHPTYPALTPLTLDPPSFADLAGVSLTVDIRAESSLERREASGGFLFTHRGFSGPALLDVSHVAVRSRLAREPHAVLRVAWGGLDASAWLERLAPSASHVGTVLRRELPQRLAERLLREAEVDAAMQLAQLPRAARERLIEVLADFALPWTSDEGYRKAEVTGGGIALDEVQPGTMASRMLSGVFIAGELLDAFGPIGGYNFSWAWVTGRLAGLGAARHVVDG